VRIPKTVRLLLELLVAVVLLVAAGALAAGGHPGWGAALAVLALPVSRLFGIAVIDSLDLRLRRTQRGEVRGDHP
jgi:hypothetical protein